MNVLFPVRAVSSNRNIADVKVLKSGYGNKYSFKVTPENKGSSTITMSGTVNGKKITEKTKVNVVDYNNPVASFKIDGKDYADKFSHLDSAVPTGKLARGKKLKVSCTPAKGWIIKYIQKTHNFKLGENVVTSATPGQRNNTTVTFNPNALSGNIYAILYNKALQKTVVLTVSLK